MVVVGVWAMFAFCVVLFVRGASSRADHPNRTQEKPARASAGADASRAKV
jgi:hypothetical protein